MSLLDLSPNELLSTTRSVRKRLDFSRPVEPEVIQECLELAAQAPTGGNNQNWHFVVVTNQQQRQALGEIYRKGFAHYQQLIFSGQLTPSSSATAPEQVARYRHVRSSSQYLLDHIHEVPVMIVPCIYDRVDDQPTIAGQYVGIDLTRHLELYAGCTRSWPGHLLDHAPSLL